VGQNCLVKRCWKCKREKKISEFYKTEENKDKLKNSCKECCRELAREWYKNNKKRAALTSRKWKKRNPNKVVEAREKWRKKRVPWYRVYRGIVDRCANPKHNYFKRGIKNFLKPNDIKFLWFRDKAWLLEQPSIDRKDGKKHYTLDNCRFIELKKNLKRERQRKGAIYG